LKKLKLSRLWKNYYIRIVISVILVLISLTAFWFCLMVAFKSGYPLLPIDAGSMNPALNVGDLVVVQGVSDASEIKLGEKPEGDIIVFREPSTDRILVQRAIDRNFVGGVWYFRTQKDNASLPAWWSMGHDAEDTWGGGFHQKFLIGKVVGKIPYLGYIPLYVSAFLRTPEVIFLFIVLMCLIILIKYPSLLKKRLKPQTKAL